MDLTSPSGNLESDPTFAMLDVSDDEETIALEESLEPEIDPQEELRILANDLNVSVEQLTAQSGSRRSKRNRKKVDYQAMLLEERRKKKPKNVVIRQPKSLAEMCSKVVQDMKVDQAGPSKPKGTSNSVSELTKFYLTNTLTCYEDEEGDTDYKPMLKPTFAREIRTGPLYQADVPEESSKNSGTDKEVPFSDILLWKPPPVLSEDEIKVYLCQVNSVMHQVTSGDHSSRRTPHQDNELALEILLQSNFNKELALDIFKQKLQVLNCENILNETVNSKENIDKVTKNDSPSPPKITKQ